MFLQLLQQRQGRAELSVQQLPSAEGNNRNSRSSWQRGGGDWEVGREESSNNLPTAQTLFPLQFWLRGEAASRKTQTKTNP